MDFRLTHTKPLERADNHRTIAYAVGFERLDG